MESEPEPQPAGGTEYAAYLLIDDLLELQRPLTPGAHDELLFIVVHQAYELWFKLMLHELAQVDAELRRRPAGRRADRASSAWWRSTGCCSPSSTCSRRWGPRASSSSATRWRPPAASSRASSARSSARSCRAVAGVLRRRAGCRRTASSGSPRSPTSTATTPTTRCARVRHEVCELLVDHDETIQRWRFHHTLMAAREIGTRPGTGGSRGVEYLRGTVDKRFFRRAVGGQGRALAADNQ